jgi:hypothetical protein
MNKTIINSMDRRCFLKMMAASSTSVFIPSIVSGNDSFPFESQSGNNELAYHTLEHIKFDSVQLRYPRLVGKNSRLGVHGTGPKITCCTLTGYFGDTRPVISVIPAQ